MNFLRRIFGRRNIPAWVVLFVSLSLTLLTLYGLRQQAEKSAAKQFNLYVMDVVEAIEERLHQHEQILLGAAGLFDSSATVTRKEWHTYINRLDLNKNYPGILGVGYSQLIKPADLNGHIATVRREGFPAYTVRPAGERELYTAIVYLEPFSGRNLAAFGYDMMSESNRSEAMHAAVESGKTAISARVKLVQETHGKVQAGFLMYVPVYRQGMPLDTAAQRWAALHGYVFSPNRADDLMAKILGKYNPLVDFRIFDGKTESDDTKIFDSRDSVLDGASPSFTVLKRIMAYGHEWSIRLDSRPDFDAGLRSSTPVLVFTLGAGVSLLLFALVSFLTFRREQAEQMAMAMTRDIRANERELSLSEAKLQGILDGAEHLIISTDVHGIIQLFNHSAERHLGYRAEELVGKQSAALFHLESEVRRGAEDLQNEGVKVEPGFEVFVARARNHPAGNTRQWSYVRKDGSTFPVSLTVTALRDEQGEINAFLGVATDISEREAAAKTIRDDAARMAAILDNVLDGIITINERGDIESFNKAAKTIFGYSEEEVVGRNVKMLMPEPYHTQHDGYLHNFVNTGERKIIGIGRQVVGLRKDGSTFPMDLAVSEMKLGERRMFTGIVRDVTERVKVDQMKSEFISTVSHELRTPLTSIRGALALITGGVVGELPAAVKPLVDIAHKNSERLILLVNDILDIEKIQAGKMEFDLQPQRLMPLLKQALDGNRAYAEQFGVSYELESELPEVMVAVDANRLMQVFANLLSNAAKFSPAAGNVSISVEQRDNLIRVSIKDHGPGISDEFKARIFQKFAQADSSDTRKKGGTGLGLAITKAIVEQMGGNIGFESQPNVVTEFYFEFAEWLQQQADITQLSANRRVLVCEDSRDNAEILRKMLESGGYAVDVVYDTDQARQLLRQPANYVAMTLDIGLPVENGLMLLRDLRRDETTASLPVLIVSATASEERRKTSGEALGISDWLQKPVEQAELLAALKRLVNASAKNQSNLLYAKVLHVEDDDDVVTVVRGVLIGVAETMRAATLADARRMLEQQRFDLVILDLDLAGESGTDLLKELNGFDSPIPVVIFSAMDVGPEIAEQVDAILVKSRSNNEQLVEIVKNLTGVA